jgi:cytochrome P450
MTQAEPIVFNPLDPGFRVDPYPVYRRLLAEDPVHETPFGRVFSRYEDCVAVLKDHRHWSSDIRNAAQPGFEPPMGDFLDVAGRPFLFLDPPDHTRLRRLVSKAFTPRVVETLRPRIQQIVDELLDAVAEKGSFEVIEDLAYPVPVVVISEMLGVPPGDHETFRGWSRELAQALDPNPFIDAETVRRRLAAIESFDEYFRRLIAERKKEPRDDLLSALIAAEEEGDRLTEPELLSTARLILIAGHETTVNLIGNGTLALLRHPDQLRLLRDDPSLAKSAVEEVLRYDPPVQYTGRIAVEEVEVAGAQFKPGQSVVTLIGAANRDPAQFEDPERFDITRDDDRHLAFGFGIHYCLGAPLARVEGQIALSALVRRFDGLELLVDRPEYGKNIVLRGLAALPVGFSGAAAAAN